MNNKKINTKVKETIKEQPELDSHPKYTAVFTPKFAPKVAPRTVSKLVAPKSQKPLPIENIVDDKIDAKLPRTPDVSVSKPKTSKASVSKPLPEIVVTPVSKPIPKTVSKLTSKSAAVNKKTVKKESLKSNPENDAYFVYLKSPLEYRRQLLECSRKVLFCLKINQEVFLIRQRKLEEMRRLKNSIKELLYLSKKFNDKLPKYNMHVLGDVPTKNQAAQIPLKLREVKKPVISRSDMTEMERLEESLANIEKKLKTLQ